MNLMNLQQIELRYLRYFVVLAQELNFRRASERLYVSTPALSVQIKKLEDILEVQLLERDTAKVRLTVPGEVLLREASELLQRMEEIVAITKDAAQGNRGHLRIGLLGFFTYSFMPGVLKDFRQRYPKVEVLLLDMDVNQEQLDALESGRTHIGFFYSFGPLRLKNTEQLLILDMPIRAVMSARHPLAAKKEVSLAELAAVPLLDIRRYEPQTRHLEEVFHKKKLAPKSLAKANSFNAAMTILASGENVAMLPEMRLMTQNPKLTLRPIKDQVPGLRLQVYAVWQKTGASPQVLNFIDLLRQSGVHND